MKIWTCLSTVDVLLNVDTAAIINQEIPDDATVTTAFERWIHPLLIETAADDSYNVA
jgi:hypothetical protein